MFFSKINIKMVKQGMKQNKILVLHDAIVDLCIYVFPFQRKSCLQDLNTFQMLSEKIITYQMIKRIFKVNTKERGLWTFIVGV